jgi:hypothetical protein
MHAAELTPIERGALLVLMAEGRPLKERAELKGIHGIALEASHRSKLQRLGLIQTTKKPFTHSLSEEGWQWARKEIGAPKPKGVMGMGALYSVLGGLRRYIDRHGIGLEGVFCAAEPTVTDGLRQHIREAAWSEADEALGQALQDVQVFTAAIDKLRNASSSDPAGLVKRTRMAAELVLQSVRQAGRKRELSLAVEAGSEATFDPAIHRSDEALEPGERVRVRKPPVMRGSGNSSVAVLLGEVEPIREVPS